MKSAELVVVLKELVYPFIEKVVYSSQIVRVAYIEIKL